MQEYLYEDLLEGYNTISETEDIKKSSNSLAKRVLNLFKMYFIQISITVIVVFLCCLPYLLISPANAHNQTKVETTTTTELKAFKFLPNIKNRTSMGEIQKQPNKFIPTTSATTFINKPFKVSTNLNQELSQNKSDKFEAKNREILSSMKVTVYNTTNNNNNKQKIFGPNRLASPKTGSFINLMNSTENIIAPNFANKSSKISFGEEVSGSLFRPSFLKGLLSTQKLSNGGGSNQAMAGGGQPVEEEEEEVTQTIVVPMSGQQAAMASSQVESDDQFQANPSSSYPSSKSYHSAATMFANNNHHTQHQFIQPHNQHNQYSQQNLASLANKETQPKPEASLQLTRTEMNQLLNDREAPEFYKEREVNGEGVMVGEEQPRLGTAASNMGGYGGGGGGSFPMSASSFDGGDSFGSGNNRLLQSPSEDPSFGGGSGGFNHRFGQSFGNSGDDFSGPSMGSNSGRLMQSPAEFNDVNSGSGFGPGMGMGSEGRNFGGYGQNEFSSHGSSLMKAGSGSNEFDGVNELGPSYDSSGFDGRGGMGMHSSGGGYSNSPGLDRHASELYGSGFNQGQFGSSGDFASQHGGRLMGAGSNSPGSFGGSSRGMPFGGGDEYSTRFGSAGAGFGGGYNQQGFANSNSMMMRGNSMTTNSMQDTSGLNMMREPNIGGSGRKLRPLSPVIAVAEELGSSSNYREVSSEKGNSRDQFGGGGGGNSNYQQGRQSLSQPQVHEGLEDDPTSPADTEDDSESSSNQYESTSGVQGSNMGGGQEGSDGSLNGGVADETTTASVQEMQVRASKAEMGQLQQLHQQQQQQQHQQQQQQGPSLVLNVPPPNIDNSFSQLQMSNNQNRPMVEFSRVGTAGYLAPNMRTDSSIPGIEISQSPGESFRLKQKILKKSNAFMASNNQQQLQNQQRDSYDPAENPAHAGKYIID